MGVKILVISYSYLPALNPRAFRWAAIAQHWASQGHEVDIVCGSAAGHPAQENLHGVRIHRVRWLGLARLREKMKTAARPHGADATSLRMTSGRWLSQQLRRLWELLCWPDYACLWYWNARNKAVQLAASNRYDLLISSSLPFTGHLVGLAVRKRHPALPWLVDVGDPFSFREGEATGNAFMYRRLNLRMEHRVFAAATAISVTTPGTASRYAQIFDDCAEKLSVIPPLLPDVSQSMAMASNVDNDGKKVRLVFIGTLYRSLRSPEPLLHLFAKLLASDLSPSIELHFYGNIQNCSDSFEAYRRLLGHSIHLHGLAPREQAFAAMRDASILVNIGNTSAYQLPSKVVEYLAMYKPIINMVSGADDSSASFFADFDGVLTIIGDEACVNSTRFAEVQAFVQEPPAIDEVERATKLQLYGIDSISGSYLSLLGPTHGRRDSALCNGSI